MLWPAIAAALCATFSAATTESSLVAGGPSVAVDVTSDTASSLPGTLSPSGFVLKFRISPDSRYAVYGSPASIYSRRLPDGPPVQLARPDSCWTMSNYFLITDDSATVLFTCRGDSPSDDLWAVPITGPSSAATLVSKPPDAPYEVNEFYSATSASRIFYTMPRVDPFRVELYSVPVEGPASAGIAINGPLGEGGRASAPFPLRQSSRVVYGVRRPWPQASSIWMTALTAPNAVEIGVPPTPFPIGGWFVVAPNEQRVVWTPGDENENYSLFSAPISDPPGKTVQLTANVPLSTLRGETVISPDSTRVVFVSDQENLQPDLFSVPIDGPSSAAVNLSDVPPDWYPQFGGMRFSPDSGWMIYLGDREVAGRLDLYAVPAAGPASANVRINPADATTEAVGWVEAIPETSEVVFSLASTTPQGAYRCYRGSWLGGTGNATPLWTEPLLYQHIGCHWLVDSQSVLTASEDPFTDWAALWLAHGDGPPDLAPKKLLDSKQFEPRADPFTYGDLEATPDGRFVVYLGQPLGGDLGLWVLPLPFFWDGFESGGTGHWSSSEP